VVEAIRSYLSYPPGSAVASKEEISMKLFIALTLVLVIASSASGFEKKAYMMKQDFGMEELYQYDTALQYYYYMPCPTYSWYWGFSGWQPGEIIGVTYDLGTWGAGGFDPPDPYSCHTLRGFRVLDLVGLGDVYPELFGVRFEVWCADLGCYNPIGPALWDSGLIGLHQGWNYIWIDPDGVCITPCCHDAGPPPSRPAITITATMVGFDATYPMFAFDNISTPVEQGCVMHDYGCLPALYPRPHVSHWPNMHTGYFGTYQWEYWPPLWFPDGAETTSSGEVYGFVELAMTAYFICSGPTATQPTTWSNLKFMYR
jgi:hypothetical protein